LRLARCPCTFAHPEVSARERAGEVLPEERRPTPGAKTGGRDFVKGQNSHGGEVFRRTEDQLPRGNGMLMLRIIYHDKRKKLYDQACSLIDKSPRAALAFLQDYVDRTEGLPTKRIEKTIRRPATFVFSNPDGTETPALPEQVGIGATPGAASAEDQVILGLEPLRI
jgi:hypothetical protein